MKRQTGLALLLAASERALAQQVSDPWGQCRSPAVPNLRVSILTCKTGGGNNYSGPTACPSGYHCYTYHECESSFSRQSANLVLIVIGYSQCIPGQATVTSSTTLVTSTSSAPSPPSSSAPPPSTTSSSTPEPTSSPGVCSGSFNFLTAEEWVEASRFGWNLGNSLDAIPNEDSWNNSPVQDEVFDYVVEQGFTSVRIPGTYAGLVQDTAC